MKFSTILIFAACILGGGIGNVIASPVPPVGSSELALDPGSSSTSHPVKGVISSPDSALPNVTSEKRTSTNNDRVAMSELSITELRALYRKTVRDPNSLADPSQKLSNEEKEELYSRLTNAKDDNSDLAKMTPAEREEEARRITIALYDRGRRTGGLTYPGETEESLFERKEALEALNRTK